jgi:hypothetical protein
MYYYFNKLDKSKFISATELTEKHNVLLGIFEGETLDIISSSVDIFYPLNLSLRRTKTAIEKIKKDNNLK